MARTILPGQRAGGEHLRRSRVAHLHGPRQRGQSAEVSITGSQRLDMLTVPAEAIVRDPQGAPLVFQYFPDQQRVYSKRVEIGSFYGRNVQIRSGLQGQESIVVAGQNMLRNGMGAELSQERK
jgi:multidrug efflux pump subunit AcrA (membrane-fusion protein)